MAAHGWCDSVGREGPSIAYSAMRIAGVFLSMPSPCFGAVTRLVTP